MAPPALRPREPRSCAMGVGQASEWPYDPGCLSALDLPPFRVLPMQTKGKEDEDGSDSNPSADEKPTKELSYLTALPKSVAGEADFRSAWLGSPGGGSQGTELKPLERSKTFRLVPEPDEPEEEEVKHLVQVVDHR